MSQLPPEEPSHAAERCPNPQGSRARRRPRGSRSHRCQRRTRRRKRPRRRTRGGCGGRRLLRVRLLGADDHDRGPAADRHGRRDARLRPADPDDRRLRRRVQGHHALQRQGLRPVFAGDRALVGRRPGQAEPHLADAVRRPRTVRSSGRLMPDAKGRVKRLQFHLLSSGIASGRGGPSRLRKVLPPRPSVYSDPGPRTRCGAQVPGLRCGLPADRGDFATPRPPCRPAASPAALTHKVAVTYASRRRSHG
ncbi:hypothetical protein SCOCK_250041 [Actinacidiphila cocklensis]|uniref:Uncharacterized protein n=1 Tax=Actinacidiphila cocklensis TaxID=887465 RepID=A0A9W4DRB2_9ACTN|nr:hypothetical protein SCOCK_250041 [Actinacidiphila cocklensis]